MPFLISRPFVSEIRPLKVWSGAIGNSSKTRFSFRTAHLNVFKFFMASTLVVSASFKKEKPPK